MEIIYCASGNRRFARIAIECGFLYGSQLPSKSGMPFDLHFADQDWKNPNRDVYVSEIAKYRPAVATVLDLEGEDQLGEVLGWAEDIAPYAPTVVVIPKVSGVIDRIPEIISGSRVRLGYSVPTKYGSTDVHTREFGDRPVHLLGGSPPKHRKLYHLLNVVSVDGNVATLAARFGQSWNGEKWFYNENEKGKDFMYGCFRASCEGIMRMWKEIGL